MDKLIGTSPLLLIYRHHYDILIENVCQQKRIKKYIKKGDDIIVKEWIFVDSGDFFMAPIIEDGTARKIPAECRGERAETKLYEEKEERFITYSGIRVQQKAKIKAAEIWLRENKKNGINPYALYIKKARWGFFASCVADGMFAEEELGRKKASKLGISVFELPDCPAMSSVQRKMVSWRKRKRLVTESANFAVFKDDEGIAVKASYVDDFVLSLLSNFRYDRKTDMWKGKDVESALRLVRMDLIPDTRTYGRGLYFLCETETLKPVTEYSSCFAALFSL